jgi:hypothetical protein
MRVLIVANTVMGGGTICVGAHDLEHGFRSLRLFPSDTTRYIREDALEIGSVYDMEYLPRPGITAPHVEDVTVTRLGERLSSNSDVAALVAKHDVIWFDTNELFDGTLSFTPNGGGYVDSDDPIPTRSTGYWQPPVDLRGSTFPDGTSYYMDDCDPLKRISYVGIEEPLRRIPAGSLVRLSLSHPKTAVGVTGLWLQVSGSFPT